MADKPKGKREYVPQSDISVFGDTDTSNDYPPGTTFDIGGEQVDINSVPDLIGGEGKPKPPAQQQRQQ